MKSAQTVPGEIYVIVVETVTLGIPYADSFFTQQSYCLSKCAAAESRYTVYGHIKYKKSVWGIAKSELRGLASLAFIPN